MAKLPHQSSVPPVDPQDGATKADGGAADSLQTTTTDVVVSGATAPSTGDVLTAIDGVSANWQAPVLPTGSSGVSFNSQSAEFELSSTQYANAGDVTFLDGLTEMTVEMWVNPESLSANGGFCGKAKQGTSDTFSWKLENGGFRIYLSSDGTAGVSAVFTAGIFTLNTWTHVAFTWDGSTGDVKAYVDGVQHDITKTGLVGALFNGTAPFLIGKRDDNFSHQWDGGMSELRVWGKVRTVAEIANNRFSAMSGGETDLLAIYPLDGDFTEKVAGADAAAVNGATFTNETPFYADGRAIHDNAAGEINAVALKATPVAADVILIEDSEAGFVKKKTTLTDLLGRLGPGYLDGLAMVYNTVSTVDISPGSARASDDSIDIASAGTLTADITASGANGLDTGSEASSTWYALYVIDGPTVSPASLLSTSFTSPTLPANYTVFRRVGAMRNSAGSDFHNGYQMGKGRDREWLYDNYADQTVLNGGSATIRTAVDCSAYVPVTCKVAQLSQQFTANAAGNDFRYYYASSANGLMGFQNVASAGDNSHWAQRVWIDGNQEFEYTVTSGSDVLYIYVLAYTDEL